MTLPAAPRLHTGLEALDGLEDAPHLAFDAEGDGLYRYRARLCVLQLACEGDVRLLDTLALDSLAGLAPILGAEGPRKIVHDAAFDARMLAGHGVALGHVFDTAVAARMLDEKATGLASLVERYLGVKLEKGPQKADWGRRPLPEEDLGYLVDDVRYLVPLAEHLEGRVEALGIVEEVRHECEHVLERAWEPERTRPPWTRVKGAATLPTPVQARLRALTELRESWAESDDVPPFRLVPNGALLGIATSPKASPRGRWRHELAAERIDALMSLAKAPAEEVPQAELLVLTPPVPPPEVRAMLRARERALSTWRRAQAEARGVSEQAVLPGHCLRALARLDALDDTSIASVAGFGDFRRERYGDALIDLLRAASSPEAAVQGSSAKPSSS